MSNAAPHHNGALDSFAVIALVITFLLRYAPFLSSHLLFLPFVDNMYVYGPLFSEASRLAAAGEVPYYLPSFGTGFPVFDNPDFSILYPFYFFGVVNYGDRLASLYTLTNLTLVHIFVFYLNLYVLLRCATITPWASYIGASVGLLAQNTTVYASWVTITATYAWLPLLHAGAVLLLRSPARASGIIVFSVSAGLLALAQPAQSVIHAALVCLILFLTGVGWLFRQRRFSEIWSLIRSLAICSGIAFGLAGAAILPMYIATGDMIRFVGAGNAVIGHEHIPWTSFDHDQLTLSQARGILLRPNWIDIVGSPYVGPLGVVGVLLAAAYFRRLSSFLRMLLLASAIISLYGLLSGFGTNLGFAYVNFHLPFINRIREAGRHLVLFAIGASFLSGVGYMLLGQAIDNYRQNRNARQLIVPVALMLVFLATIAWELVYDADPRFVCGFWIVALAPLLFIIGRVLRLGDHGKIGAAALLVSAAAMVVPVRGYSPSTFYAALNRLSHRVILSFINRIDVSNYRVDFLDRVPNLPAFPTFFWGMNASYYGIKSFYNQQTPQPYSQFRFSSMAKVPHLRQMMGARYVLCGPSTSPPDEGAKEILATEGYRLYENPRPMGRLTLLHRAAGWYRNENDFLERIGTGFDYLSEAYFDRAGLEAAQRFFAAAQPLPNAQDRIEKVKDEANRSYSVVNSDSPSLLILNEWFTPAWKVRVNGRSERTVRVNEWQVSVLLRAGTNRVQFDYQPTLFRALMVINHTTAVALLIFLIFAVSRKASRRQYGYKFTEQAGIPAE